MILISDFPLNQIDNYRDQILDKKTTIFREVAENRKNLREPRITSI